MMWSQLVFAKLLAVGAAAFTPVPIRWGGFSSKRFLLMPASSVFPRNAAERPHELTIREHFKGTSSGEIPRFTVKFDATIAWESQGLCIEASGIRNGNLVRLNQCDGGLTQKWNWFPWGAIQLKGTNQCIGALVDKEGRLNGAPVGLRECANTASEPWDFEAPEEQQPQHADLFFQLAILYWAGLSTAFLVSIFDKLWNRGLHAQSPPLVMGGHVAAVMDVQPDPITRTDGVMRRTTSPTMVVVESSSRSVVKSVLWRFAAGFVTACTSMFFTRSLATAATIVGWDLCSKSVTMFMGERVWNKFNWGRKKGKDAKRRSLAKALLWRLFASLNTLFASIVLTKGSVGVAGKIAGADTMIIPALFFFYERMWANISWGKMLREETKQFGVETMDTSTKDERGLMTALSNERVLELINIQDGDQKFSFGSDANKTLSQLGDAVDPLALGIGARCRKGLKPAPNQDSWGVVKVGNDFSIYGVYDGHGHRGHDVSNFVKENIPKLILRDQRFKTDQMREMMKDVFIKIQSLIADADRSNRFSAQMSGATATVVIHNHDSKQLLISHVADSTCVIGRYADESKRQLKGVALTRDHKPDLPDEKARILKAGGLVLFDGYTNHRVYAKDGSGGGLNMSRCLGDLSGHAEAGLSCEPEVNALDIGPLDHLLLLCSDGVWEFISPDEAVGIVGKFGPHQATEAAEALAQEARDRWIQEEGGDYVDDITVVLMYLDPPKRTIVKRLLHGIKKVFRRRL